MLVSYEVHYWDDEDHQGRTDAGILQGDDWNQIVARLNEYYGEVNFFTLCPLEDVLMKDELRQLLQGWDK